MRQTFLMLLGSRDTADGRRDHPDREHPQKMVASTVHVRTYPTAPLTELSNPRHGS